MDLMMVILGYVVSESKYDGEDGCGDRYGGREY